MSQIEPYSPPGAPLRDEHAALGSIWSGLAQGLLALVAGAALVTVWSGTWVVIEAVSKAPVNNDSLVFIGLALFPVPLALLVLRNHRRRLRDSLTGSLIVAALALAAFVSLMVWASRV